MAKFLAGRKWLRRALVAFACLMGLIILIVAGVLIWLRTPHAERKVAELVGNALASQGLRMETDEFRGPLPGHLYIRNLRLYDEDGLWLRVGEARLELALFGLLEGTLKVEELSLVEPEVLRAPVLPPKEDDAGTKESGGSFSLPVAIDIGEARLENGRVFAALFLPPESSESPNASATAATDEAGKFLLVELSARGHVSNRRLELSAEAAATHADGSGFKARLSLEPRRSHADEAVGTGSVSFVESHLDLLVEARENGGTKGLIAWLAGREVPACGVKLQGSAPIRHWRGRLEASAAWPDGKAENVDYAIDVTAADAGALGGFAGTISLDPGEGPSDLGVLLAKHWAVQLDGEFSPGPALAGYLPLEGDFGLRKVDLEVDLHLRELVLQLNTLRVETDAWMAALNDVNWFFPAMDGVKLTGKLKAQVKGHESLAALQSALAPESEPLPLDGANLESAFIVSLMEESGRSMLQVNGALKTAYLGEDAPVEIRGREQTLEYFVLGAMDTLAAGGTEEGGGSAVFSLPMVKLSGLGLEVEGSAQLGADMDTGKLKLGVNAANAAIWQSIARAFGDIPLGALALNADLDYSMRQDGTEQFGLGILPGLELKGDITFTAREMSWPDDTLRELLGSDINLSMRVDKPRQGSVNAELHTLNAGAIKGSGKASMIPLRADGAGQLYGVHGNLAAELNDLGVLAAGAGGPVSAKVEVSGTTADMKVALAVNSPLLKLNDLELPELRADVDARVLLPASGPEAHGSISASSGKINGKIDVKVDGNTGDENGAAAESGPGVEGVEAGEESGGEILLDALWKVSVKEDLTFSLDEFKAQAFAADLRGSLQGVVPAQAGSPESPARPRITGSLGAEFAGWSYIGKLAGVELSGDRARASLELKVKDGAQSANLVFMLPRASMLAEGEETLRVEELEFTAQATDVFSDAALKANLQSRGGFAGPVSWDRAGVAFDGGPEGGSFDVRLFTETEDSKEAAKKAEQRQEETQRRRNRIILRGKGSVDLARSVLVLDTLRLRKPMAEAGISLDKAATLSFAQGIKLDEARFSFEPSGSLAATVSLEPGRSVFKAVVEELPFQTARLFTEQPLPMGHLNLDLDFEVKGGEPAGNAEGLLLIMPTQESAFGGYADAVTVTLEARLDKNPTPRFSRLKALPGITRLIGSLNITQAQDGQDGSGYLSYDFPLRFDENGIPSVPSDVAFITGFSWQGLVAPLWALVPMPDRYLSGAAQANLFMGGTIDDMIYGGTAYLAGGRYEDKVLGVLLADIEAEAKLQPDGEGLVLVSGGDGNKGTFAMQGTIKPPRSRRTGEIRKKSRRGPVLDVRGQINHLAPLHRDDLYARFSGLLDIKGRLATPEVKASVTVERAEVNLISSLGMGVTTLKLDEEEPQEEKRPRRRNTAAEATVDLEINVPNRCFVYGRGLDSEWSGNLKIGGPVSDIRLNGKLSPVRGSFDFLTRAFALNKGSISFNGGERVNPALDLELSYAGPSMIAKIHAGGTAQKPVITLSSTPFLPQDQILSQVLFGKDFSELSRFEALQVANSLRELAGIGGGSFNPMNQLKRGLGVDTLRLGSSGGMSESRSVSGAPGANAFGGGTNGSEESDDTSNLTIEAGKYINDSIYVGVEQGTGEDSTAVRVEIELKPNLTLQGRSSGKASEVGLGWKKDY